MLKYIYIVSGSITLTIGLIGIVTPALPVTPFMLLTAYLYAKGSPKLHQKLLENRVTGSYINRVKNGLSLKARLFSISLMWVMICFTTFVVFKDNKTMQLVMPVLGLIGTVAQLIVLKKRNKE